MLRSLAALALIAVSVPAFASSGDDRVTFGADITVAADQTAGDIACAFCHVRVHGDVRGDVAVLFGTVLVDPGHSISGDLAMLGGNLSLGDGAVVDGDVAIAAGDAHLAPGASIHGDSELMPGRFWLLIPLVPLLILIGIIWLVVWIVRRNRYPSPGYPPRTF